MSICRAERVTQSTTSSHKLVCFFFFWGGVQMALHMCLNVCFFCWTMHQHHTYLTRTCISGYVQQGISKAPVQMSKELSVYWHSWLYISPSFMVHHEDKDLEMLLGLSYLVDFHSILQVVVQPEYARIMGIPVICQHEIIMVKQPPLHLLVVNFMFINPTFLKQIDRQIDR